MNSADVIYKMDESGKWFLHIWRIAELRDVILSCNRVPVVVMECIQAVQYVQTQEVDPIQMLLNIYNLTRRRQKKTYAGISNTINAHDHADHIFIRGI